jgi:hypothetical protein
MLIYWHDHNNKAYFSFILQQDWVNAPKILFCSSSAIMSRHASNIFTPIFELRFEDSGQIWLMYPQRIRWCESDLMGLLRRVISKPLAVHEISPTDSPS